MNRTPESSALMPELLIRFRADRACLERQGHDLYSPWQAARVRGLLDEWRETVENLHFTTLSRADRADWLLLRSLLAAEGRRLDREASRWAEMQPLLPFALDLIGLEEARMQMARVDGRDAAGRLDAALTQLHQGRTAWEQGRATAGRSLAGSAAQFVDRLCLLLEAWFQFSDGYDPSFGWWAERPYRTLQDALTQYTAFLRGADGEAALPGAPIGRDALLEDLQEAMIAYAPEDLMGVAHREMDWCRAEMRRAARQMGCGDDWRAALELVKEDHAAPGEQPALVRDLAREAIRYVEDHALVTVPPLARECWRMEMMSAERQQINPFFLGGETIVVSFPVSEMSHSQKQMSLRGNNRAFARATVYHELIPGHHLQGFCQQRYRPERRLFSTPFWTEGWTLHWEMLFWERGFARTPQERLGMLFWRQHRAARVLFTLGFHLGQMTADECVEYLVAEVGHERANAQAEVRRSFAGDYDPLYQCAYLIGGLQVHALYREMVGTGRQTDREFHDAFLRENCMPVALLRALLTGEPLERDFRPDWPFLCGPD